MECHMNVTWLPQELHMTVTWMPQECHRNVTQMQLECHSKLCQLQLMGFNYAMAGQFPWDVYDTNIISRDKIIKLVF